MRGSEEFVQKADRKEILPGVQAANLLGHQELGAPAGPIWGHSSGLGAVLSVDPEIFRNTDTWSRTGPEVLCVGCCCTSGGFSGRRIGDRRILDRFPGRILPECCGTGGRTGCRTGPGRSEVPWKH